MGTNHFKARSNGQSTACRGHRAIVFLTNITRDGRVVVLSKSMRKLIPHALLAVLTLGAGVAALASFQSTRFSAARAELVAAPCKSQTTGQAIPSSTAPIEAIIPADAVDNAGLYATPTLSKLIAVAPVGWVCQAVTAELSGVVIFSGEDPTAPMTVLQFLAAFGPVAERVACPFSQDAKDQIFKNGGDDLVAKTCAPSDLVSITGQEGGYTYITVTSAESGPQYALIAYSNDSHSAKAGVCIPSDSLTPGKPDYMFDQSKCKQYLRAFARNNPIK